MRELLGAQGEEERKSYIAEEESERGERGEKEKGKVTGYLCFESWPTQEIGRPTETSVISRLQRHSLCTRVAHNSVTPTYIPPTNKLISFQSKFFLYRFLSDQEQDTQINLYHNLVVSAWHLRNGNIRIIDTFGTCYLSFIERFSSLQRYD